MATKGATAAEHGEHGEHHAQREHEAAKTACFADLSSGNPKGQLTTQRSQIGPRIDKIVEELVEPARSRRESGRIYRKRDRPCPGPLRGQRRRRR